MSPPLAGWEPAIRLGSFVGTFTLLAIWERLAVRRQPSASRRRRWASNLGAIVVNTVILRLLFPASAVGVAVLSARHGWGVLRALDLPPALAVALSVIALDLAMYLQHILFHAVPGLWRVHQVHHADLDVDVTTGVRVHVIEGVLSMVFKAALVVCLGAPPVAVLLFEVLLNASVMFNHANVRLPPALDAVLRLVVVTPDMHRIHHSLDAREHGRNFGFSFSWWDRLLGTYARKPLSGHEQMTVGLAQYRDPGRQTLGWLLLLPFGIGDSPSARRV